MKFEAGADPTLTADLALALVKDRDLIPKTIEQISRNTAVMKARKVRVALAAHPRTPRRIALRLIRELYAFDLMQFSLLPAVAADLKHIANESMVARLASITLGERISLAQKSSAMVAAALLLDKQALSSMPSATTPNGRCDRRFSWPSCATRTRRWPVPSNSRAALHPHKCAISCTRPVCRKKSKYTCATIWREEERRRANWSILARMQAKEA